MEHKIIIEVRIIHPTLEEAGIPTPKVVQVDPQMINSLLSQLPAVLAGLQPKPTPEKKK